MPPAPSPVANSPLPHAAQPRVESLVIVGGGGHALVIAEAAAAMGFHLPGFFDDQTVTPLNRGKDTPGFTHLGRLNDLARIGDRPWILAIGGLGVRSEILATLASLQLGGFARTVIHPTAHVSPSAVIGRGVFIGANAVVQSRARIADHAIINTGVIVEHECVIQANAHLGPGTVLGGNVTIGTNTLIGLGSRVLPGLSVGDGCTVGAGAVVISSITDGTTAAGVPAKIIKRG